MAISTKTNTGTGKLFLITEFFKQMVTKTLCGNIIVGIILSCFNRVSLVQGGAPGTIFDRGSHTIVYSASNKMGATAFCYFTFEITGI